MRDLHEFASVEIYADEATAMAALSPWPGGHRVPGPPLPDWASAPKVIEAGGVTRLRPDDADIRSMDLRPGLRYRDLVRHCGRDRLVLDLTGIRPFGHPFHDDVFAILRELGPRGGRLGICGAGSWFIERLQWYRSIRVIPGPPGFA